MALGEKLRQARLDAGLSQQALCNGEITRNMLSRIENGAAQPSMKTLQYLAARLGKPMSFFLEETAVTSPNQEIMESARRLFDTGEYDRTALVLEGYRSPDSVYDREKELLCILTRMAMAEQAIVQGKDRLALELLEGTEIHSPYCAEALNRQRLLLLGRVRGGPQVCAQLPSLDEELMLRSAEAIHQGDARYGAHLLDAMQHRNTPRWMLLRGEAYLAESAFQDAAQCFLKAEAVFPEEVIPRLEHCYRELGDFRLAYQYACRQKKKT